MPDSNRTLVLLTHANANHDGSEISTTGRNQASLCRHELGFPEFDFIFRSPAPCAASTARVVAGISERELTDMLPSLFLVKGNWDDDLIRAELKTHSPPLNLRMLFEQNAKMRQVLETKVSESKENILRIVAKKPTWKALVVGHNLLIQALCMSFFDTGEKDCTLNVQLGECEGFQLTLDTQGSVLVWDEIHLRQSEIK